MSVCFCRNVRSRKEFEGYAADVGKSLYQQAHELKEIVETIVVEYYKTRQELAGLVDLLNPRGDVTRVLMNLGKELLDLLPDNFVTIYDRHRLAQLPRYIRGYRLQARRVQT